MTYRSHCYCSNCSKARAARSRQVLTLGLVAFAALSGMVLAIVVERWR